jgi:hypothetical protein
MSPRIFFKYIYCMHCMILMSKKMMSQKKLGEIKLVPYNKPHFDTGGVQSDESMTMMSIKDGKIPDVTLRYCPDWTAPNKSGRPKKAERRKSGLEKAMAKAKGGKKPPKMKRRRCAICAKWNHKTKDCFVLTRHKNDNEMTTIVPMGTTVDYVTGGGRMEDDGWEGAV